MMLIASPVKRTEVEKKLGYTAEEFRKHIEKQFKPGMTWENYGKGPGKWNIDHITPLVEWHPEAPVENVSSLDNIQPLWSEENSQKNGKGAKS